MSFATLGDGDTKVTFEVSADLVRTFTDLNRRGSARWAEHNVYAGKPVSEFVGPDLDSFEFSIRFDADKGVVPRDELRNLRTLRDTGAVLPLVIGGELVGDYRIADLDEDLRRLSPTGALLTAIVKVSLREYH